MSPQTQGAYAPLDDTPRTTSDAEGTLHLMLTDLRGAPGVYQPTNYWQNYAKPIVGELRRFDVRAFRRQRGSLTDAFGALDLAPAWVPIAQHRRLNNGQTRRVPGLRRVLMLADRLLNDGLLSRALRVRAPYGLTVADLRDLAYEMTAAAGERVGARPLTALSVSRVGDPEDAWDVAGRTVTMSALYYYLRYAYVARFVDFASMRLVVELGSGAGKQAEVLHALYPHLTIALFDLPPQLYVAERFLRAAYPAAVTNYEAGRAMPHLGALGPGRIGVFGNWRLPDLLAEPADIFWNAASFQEMEPDVVAHYLGIVRNHARHVYIQAMMDGQTRARGKGRHGVLEPVVLDHYRRGLTGFTLVDCSPSLLPFGPARGAQRGYSDSFWARDAKGTHGTDPTAPAT